MSSSTVADWCPTCSEACPDHPTVCTVCGDVLIYRPIAVVAATTSPSSSSRAGGDDQRSVRILSEARAALSALRDSGELEGMEGAPNVMDMEERLGSMVRTVAALQRSRQQGGGAANANLDGDGWQRPPPEAMEPAPAGNGDRPTSMDCLDQIPRIKVDERSAVLHECAVEVLAPPPSTSSSGGGGGLRRTALSLDATVAEFGPAPPYSVTGRLVIVSPSTGKGALSSETVSALGGGNGRTIAFVKRGGGVTFARKALLAQEVGASAVVVENNVGVWPYVMRDSKGESSRGRGLRIPIVMVKRSDGAKLRRLVRDAGNGASVRCSVSAEPSSSSFSSQGHSDCVVCRSAFAVGETVVRLPTCAHCFHEECALVWLRRHNTCPYCRRELPTDDEEYERERRRRGRTHGGEDEGDSSNASNQWEDIFG